MIRILLITLLFSLSTLCLAQPAVNENGIVGVWLVEQGDGYVEITRQGNSYHGIVIGAPEGSRENLDPLDVNNKNPKLRSRPLHGMELMGGYKFNGKRWIKGWVYDPSTGKKYNSRLFLKDDDTLEVRGYVGSPKFGKTKVWKRVDNVVAEENNS